MPWGPWQCCEVSRKDICWDPSEGQGVAGGSLETGIIVSNLGPRYGALDVGSRAKSQTEAVGSETGP